MHFEIKSYEGAGPVRFGAPEGDVIAALGEPIQTSTNWRGDRIFDYEHMNVGFDKNGHVAHLGFLPGSHVSLGNRDVFREGAFEELLELDGDPMEVVGMIVLLNLGISLSGFHDTDQSQLAVTAFARGTYDRLRDRMKRFKKPIQ